MSATPRTGAALARATDNPRPRCHDVAMTTPNAYTRTTLVDVAGRTTATLVELDSVLPHMRVVAQSLPGTRGEVARLALDKAEAAYAALMAADRSAEAAKTLFRSATTPGLATQPALDATCPAPTTLTRPLDSGPAFPALGSGAAAMMRRQV